MDSHRHRPALYRWLAILALLAIGVGITAGQAWITWLNATLL